MTMANSGLTKQSVNEQDLLAINKSLGSIYLSGSLAYELVDTPVGIVTLVDTLIGLPTSPPSLYIDLEGINLSRHGSISILQIFVSPSSRTYLVDIHTLRNKAFSTCGQGGCTLKEILESGVIPKVFFDVRNDSDALYSHFHINLAGIQDLQLMELATRTFPKRFVNGLSKCIERDAPLVTSEREMWKAIKEKGVRLFAPEHGGTYEVFNERPLPQDIKLYCIQDVQFLPRLWSCYDTKLTTAWRARVHKASKDRVILSQSSGYNGKGQHMALPPTGWAYL